MHGDLQHGIGALRRCARSARRRPRPREPRERPSGCERSRRVGHDPWLAPVLAACSCFIEDLRATRQPSRGCGPLSATARARPMWSMPGIRLAIRGLMFNRLFGRKQARAGLRSFPTSATSPSAARVRLDPLAWRRLGADLQFSVRQRHPGDRGPGPDRPRRRRLRPPVLHRRPRDVAGGVQRPRRGRTSPTSPCSRPGRAPIRAPRPSARPGARGCRRAPSPTRACRSTAASGSATRRREPGAGQLLGRPARRPRRHRRPADLPDLHAVRPRPAGDGRELLLAIEQETEGGDVSFEIMVGIPLELGEFRA